jgi:hypothetical protein
MTKGNLHAQEPMADNKTLIQRSRLIRVRDVKR